MTRFTHRRGGFTLLEMVVVLGIIMLLTALTLGAVFRVREQQLEKNTNTHLQKLYIGFMQQWDATRDQVAKEPIPQPIKDMTRNANGQYDVDRARAIYMKLRLRQEFPHNSGEVMDSFSLTMNGQTASFTPRPYLATPFIGVQGIWWTNSDPDNAAMFYLIMTQGKGGATFDVSNVCPTGTVNVALQAGGTKSMKCFVDEWGSPIVFRRQVDDDNLPLIAEFNQSPFVSPAQMQSGNCDPDDPYGRLRLPKNQWWTEPQIGNGRDLFWNYLSQPNQNKRPFIIDAFDGKNRGPTVFSAGKDRVYYYIPFQGFDDNLYAHRIQQAGKGN
jgi:type II secretory pathway pseudopilin PulG